MKKINVGTVLIDVDGTMTENIKDTGTPNPLQILIELLQRQYSLGAAEARNMILKCGSPDLHCLSEFLNSLGILPETYFAALYESFKHSIVIPSDTALFLKGMKRRGIKVCTATTNSRFVTLAKLAVGKLATLEGCEYLTAYHSGCEYGDPEGKFSADFFPNILSGHGYDPATTMMIGDEPCRDMLPALAAGIRFGVTIDRTGKEAFVERDGGFYINTLSSLLKLL